MPAPRKRGRRDADDREGNRKHRSPSAVAEPRLEDMQNRLAALRNRTPRNRPAASTAVELNQHKENGEMVDYCDRYETKITRPYIRHAARLIALQMERREEEEEEVDVVN